MRMELGEPDESGRRRPMPVAGSEHVIPCDNVIFSVGQRAGLGFIPESVGVGLTREATIAVIRIPLLRPVPSVCRRRRDEGDGIRH